MKAPLPPGGQAGAGAIQRPILRLAQGVHAWAGGAGVPAPASRGEGRVCTRPPAPYRVLAADDAQPAVLDGGGRGRLWGQNRKARRGRPLPGAPAPPAQPQEALSWGLRRPHPSRRP